MGALIQDTKNFRAPLSFNVIETSDAIDKFGLLNILVSATPILDRSPFSTICTDTVFFPRTGNESELLPSLLCGEVGNVCSLLGVAPVAYLTSISTGDAQSVPLVFNNGVLNRIVWKFTLSGDVLANVAHAKPSCSAETITETLYQLYLKMYRHDKSNFVEEDHGWSSNALKSWVDLFFIRLNIQDEHLRRSSDISSLGFPSTGCP